MKKTYQFVYFKENVCKKVNTYVIKKELNLTFFYGTLFFPREVYEK